MKINLWILLSLALISCAPGVDKTANCGIGYSYDPVSRSCISGAVPSDTPTPLTNSVTILEDSKNDQVILQYEVSNNNLASSCTIISISKEINSGSEVPPYCSCVGGVCSFYLNPVANFNGNAGFTYTISNYNGSSTPFVANVTVTPVNDPPMVVTPWSINTNEGTAVVGTLDSLVSDPDGDVIFTYLVTTNPANGTLQLNATTGIFTYTPNSFFVGTDSFKWVAKDTNGLTSNEGTVLITVNPVIKSPTGSNQTVTLNENAITVVTLAYSDKNVPTFPPLGCAISNLVNVTEMVLCTCTAGICQVTIKPKVNYFTYYKGSPVAGTSSSFNYEISNAVGTTGKYLVTLNINWVNNPPLAVSGAANGTESTSNYPVPINFTINPPVDYDNNDGISISNQVLTYRISTQPKNGTLSNCLQTTSSGQSLNCTYTPNDGNSNGVNDNRANLSNQNVKLVAAFPGTYGSSISYLLKGGVRLGAEYLQVTGNQITVNIASGQTRASKIISLINGDLYASKLVAASVLGADNTQTSFANPIFLINPSGSSNFDEFQVIANDGVTDSVPGEYVINITPTNDNPVICEYSTWEEAYECGILGCIAPQPPVGVVTPTTTDIYYFDSNAAICWVSTGTTSNSWEIIDSHVSDQMANEQDDIWIQSIRVDQGGGAYAEVYQQLKITNVKSSDTLLLPSKNITFYYNNTLVPVDTWFGSTVSSDAQFEFAVKMVPQEGQFGDTDVSFDLVDTEGGTTLANYNVKVNNSAVNNNGWVNLSAWGPTTNHFGKKVSPTPTCSYYLDKCSLPAQSSSLLYPCVGQIDPEGAIMGSTKNLIYFNEMDGTCWLNNSPTTATTTGWVKFESYCNISQMELATECSANGSCLFSDSTPILDLTPTALNNYYYDLSTGSCYRSTGKTKGDVQKYTATASVGLQWKEFTVSGEGKIEGYDIYRRLSGGSIDLTGVKINRKRIPADVNVYEDNGINSVFGPVPSTVYYYTVKPIINDLPTGTLETFNTVRITAPPDNMVFAHRWIINQRTCELLHSTQINSLDNFSCPYIAPGEVIPPLSTSPPGIFDIGQDLLVDRFEAGCPYSLAPICTSGTRDNACIGLKNPNEVPITAPIGSIYYNRSTGECSINVGGTVAWVLVDGVNGGDNITEHRVAQMAPLTNISQYEADQFCKRSNKNIYGILGFNDPSQPLPSKLPSRLQQLAYSMWGPNFTSFEILSLETGLSLNSTSKCNTNYANGLEDKYTETATPDSSSYYTLPGSLSSTIRSLVTGSEQTKLCQSGFGVQDHVGNVAEWTLDRITCPKFAQCDGVLFGAPEALIPYLEDYFRTPSAPDTINDFGFWRLDGIRGPCNDSDADGICDGTITSWQIAEQAYGAGRMAIPMALPIQVDFPTLFPDSPVDPYLTPIGPTSGITSADLHEDTWTVNNQNIYASAQACGSMNTSGNFTNGNGAGVYNFEFLPCYDNAYNYLITGEIAINTLANEKYTLEYIQPLTPNAVLKYSYNSTTKNITVDLATDVDANISTNYDKLKKCLNRETGACTCSGDCTQKLKAELFPGISATNASTVFPMSKTTLNYVYDTVSNANEEVGFRCVTPIDYSNYIE